LKLAILGAGNIGRTLGVKWSAAGHHILFGVRDQQSSKAKAALKAAGSDASLVSLNEAISTGEVILFSTPWSAVPEIVNANASELKGKIIIDATNNFGGPEISNLAAIQAAVPSAWVFRAFNSLGWEIFDRPEFSGTLSDHFYCGPDGDARYVVEELIAAVGLRPVWVGSLEYAGLVDQLGALWVHLAFQGGRGRSIALKLLER
jgi:predicted dinucleotide-binding enzyme